MTRPTHSPIRLLIVSLVAGTGILFGAQLAAALGAPRHLQDHGGRRRVIGPVHVAAAEPNLPRVRCYRGAAAGRGKRLRLARQQVDLSALGRALNVQAVITGTLRQQGDEIWISVALADAQENAHLWGDRYPVWQKRQAFYGKPWIWNVLYNFGGKTSLNGDLPRIAGNLDSVRRSMLAAPIMVS